MNGFKIDKESLVFGFITTCFNIGVIFIVWVLINCLVFWKLSDWFALLMFILATIFLSMYRPNGKVKRAKRNKR